VGIFLVVAVALGLLVGFLSVEFPEALADDDNRLRLVIAVLWLGVLLTAVIAQVRRGQLGVMLRYALTWILIFLGIVTAYAFRDEFGFVKDRVVAEVLPQRGTVASKSEPGGETSVSFRSRSGGHFVVEAVIRGETIRFMVDTGASDVVLTPADAQRIGLHPATLNYTQRYNTANGIVMGAPVTLDRVQIGPIDVANVRASVNKAPMAGSLLGMSFLNRLAGYEVRNGVLTLKQ
jgi:aspartyl protease family protein